MRHCTSEKILEKEALRCVEDRIGFMRPSGCKQNSGFFLDAENKEKTPIEHCPHRNNGCPAKIECRNVSAWSRSGFIGETVRTKRYKKRNMVKDMGGI